VVKLGQTDLNSRLVTGQLCLKRFRKSDDFCGTRWARNRCRRTQMQLTSPVQKKRIGADVTAEQRWCIVRHEVNLTELAERP
jgi:hypothetical protein